MQGMLLYKALRHVCSDGVGDFEIHSALHRDLPAHPFDGGLRRGPGAAFGYLQREADEHGIDGGMFRHPFVRPGLACAAV